MDWGLAWDAEQFLILSQASCVILRKLRDLVLTAVVCEEHCIPQGKQQLRVSSRKVSLPALNQRDRNNPTNLHRAVLSWT